MAEKLEELIKGQLYEMETNKERRNKSSSFIKTMMIHILDTIVNNLFFMLMMIFKRNSK